MKKTLLVVLGLCLLAVVLGLTLFLVEDGRYAKALFSRYGAGTASKDLASTKINCTPKDSDAEGVLVAQFDAIGNLSGWTCTIGGDMSCSADSDGVWKTCDVSPDVMVWPPNVSQGALDNPKLYISSQKTSK